MNEIKAKISDLEALIKLSLDQRITPIFVSRPGIGKTQETKRVVCDVLKLPFMIRHPAVHDPMVYMGLPASWDEGGERRADFVPYGFLHQMIHAIEPLVVFLDDLGQCPPAVQAPLAQLVEERQINGHAISDQVHFIGATNDRTHRSGVGALFTMLANRVSLVHVETSLNDVFDYAYGTQWSDEMIGFLKFRPKYLTEWEPRSDFQNTATPRSIEKADRTWQSSADERIKMLNIAGLCGQEFAQEFGAYLPLIRAANIPDFDAIIANPDGAPMPTVSTSDPNAGSVFFAVVSGLAKRASVKTFGPIMRYANRTGFPAELRTVLCEDCVRVDADVRNTDAWSRWAMTDGIYQYQD